MDNSSTDEVQKKGSSVSAKSKIFKKPKPKKQFQKKKRYSVKSLSAILKILLKDKKQRYTLHIQYSLLLALRHFNNRNIINIETLINAAKEIGLPYLFNFPILYRIPLKTFLQVLQEEAVKLLLPPFPYDVKLSSILLLYTIGLYVENHYMYVPPLFTNAFQFNFILDNNLSKIIINVIKYIKVHHEKGQFVTLLLKLMFANKWFILKGSYKYTPFPDCIIRLHFPYSDPISNDINSVLWKCLKEVHYFDEEYHHICAKVPALTRSEKTNLSDNLKKLMGNLLGKSLYKRNMEEDKLPEIHNTTLYLNSNEIGNEDNEISSCSSKTLSFHNLGLDLVPEEEDSDFAEKSKIVQDNNSTLYDNVFKLSGLADFIDGFSRVSNNKMKKHGNPYKPIIFKASKMLYNSRKLCVKENLDNIYTYNKKSINNQFLDFLLSIYEYKQKYNDFLRIDRKSDVNLNLIDINVPDACSYFDKEYVRKLYNQAQEIDTPMYCVNLQLNSSNIHLNQPSSASTPINTCQSISNRSTVVIPSTHNQNFIPSAGYQETDTLLCCSENQAMTMVDESMFKPNNAQKNDNNEVRVSNALSECEIDENLKTTVFIKPVKIKHKKSIVLTQDENVQYVGILRKQVKRNKSYLPEKRNGGDEDIFVAEQSLPEATRSDIPEIHEPDDNKDLQPSSQMIENNSAEGIFKLDLSKYFDYEVSFQNFLKENEEKLQFFNKSTVMTYLIKTLGEKEAEYKYFAKKLLSEFSLPSNNSIINSHILMIEDDKRTKLLIELKAREHSLLYIQNRILLYYTKQELYYVRGEILEKLEADIDNLLIHNILPWSELYQVPNRTRMRNYHYYKLRYDGVKKEDKISDVNSSLIEDDDLNNTINLI